MATFLASQTKQHTSFSDIIIIIIITTTTTVVVATKHTAA
jgi:hypothetical protein